MINPVIFSFNIFGLPITLRWYGVLVMFGAIAAAWWTERELRRRGENGEIVWDAMVWVLPIGIIGARLWYVVNNILGGSTYYLDAPIKIINIPEGGLHIFGGFLFGAITLYFFLRKNNLDPWLFLDSIAPAILLGQALARPANFINQELYGPPTKLPWGIPIEMTHRLPQYADLNLFPDSTRFHPTFAYEMILNILIVLFLWWLSRRYEEELKPGGLFSAWLLLAGLSRSFIEFFRPDQPRIGETFVSYTMLVSFIMALVGLALLLARYGKLKLAWAENWEEEYHVKPVEAKPATSRARSAPAQLAVSSADEDAAEEEPADTEAAPLKPKRKPAAKKTPAAKKPAAKKAPAKKADTTIKPKK